MPTMDDDRGAMHEDGAVFEAARVRTSRGPRFLAIGVALALGGLVGLGVINRLITPDKPASARSTEGPTVAPAETTPLAKASREPTTLQERTDRFVNGPDLPAPTAVDVIALDLRPVGGDLFVHGDAFSLAVVRVSVDLEDSQGSHVAAAASVEIPGGSTAFRLGAVPRFDVRFSMPNVLPGNGVWITVVAYGDTGARLATVRRLVPG